LRRYVPFTSSTQSFFGEIDVVQDLLETFQEVAAYIDHPECIQTLQKYIIDTDNPPRMSLGGKDALIDTEVFRWAAHVQNLGDEEQGQAHDRMQRMLKEVLVAVMNEVTEQAIRQAIEITHDTHLPKRTERRQKRGSVLRHYGFDGEEWDQPDEL